MKKIFTLFILLYVSFSFSQDYYLQGYRMIPQGEIQTHIENEKHFHSKVAKEMIKEGKATGWAMLQRQGGSSSEPNIMFYVGVGDKSNLKTLGASYNSAYNKVMNSMGEDAATLVKRAISIDGHTVFNATFQRTNRIMKNNIDGFNFIKVNYANVKGNINEFDKLQKELWGNFIKKEMNRNNGSQVIWSTARKVTPNGNGYNWNYITVDGYETYEDLIAPDWNNGTKFPQGLDKINSMMEGGTFYKQVVWKILMSVNSDGDFKIHN